MICIESYFNCILCAFKRIGIMHFYILEIINIFWWVWIVTLHQMIFCESTPNLLSNLSSDSWIQNGSLHDTFTNIAKSVFVQNDTSIAVWIQGKHNVSTQECEVYELSGWFVFKYCYFLHNLMLNFGQTCCVFKHYWPWMIMHDSYPTK